MAGESGGEEPAPQGDTPPSRSRFSRANAGCAGIGCVTVILFLVVLVIGLDHPLGVIFAGVVIMAVFGSALLLWRE